MFLKRAIVVAGVLLLSAGTASALDRAHFELKSVGDFVALCDPPQNDQDRWYGIVFCRGYARGVGDFNRSLLPPGSLGVCLPTPRPTVAAVTDAYVAWARATPGESTPST